MSGLVGSNALIREMAGRQRLLVKTFLKSGAIYHFNDTLKPVAKPVAERLIAKGILVPREESGQSYVLSSEWGGIAQ